jgi:SAM-dependent methyltransferase
MSSMEAHYTEFWKKRLGIHFYPSEFLVRTMLSENCPDLKIGRDYRDKTVLDLGCGDGRNMGLLANLGMRIYGTEITQEICDGVQGRMEGFGIKAEVKVGRNNKLPFESSFFDYIVASASVYYVDLQTTFEDNMNEVLRVLKPGGYIVFTLVHPDTYILRGAKPLGDDHYQIANDPLGLRNGYTFKVFQRRQDIVEYFANDFTDVCTGYTSDDYYGLKQDLWLLVARKKLN